MAPRQQYAPFLEIIQDHLDILFGTKEKKGKRVPRSAGSLETHQVIYLFGCYSSKDPEADGSDAETPARCPEPGSAPPEGRLLDYLDSVA